MATATMSPLALYRQVRDYEQQTGRTLPQAAVLEALINGPLTITELCEAMNMKAPTATALVDGMENKGLIRRVRSTVDRRVIWLELV